MAIRIATNPLKDAYAALLAHSLDGADGPDKGRLVT